MKNGRKEHGWMCLPVGTIRAVGLGLMIAGGVLIVAFVPLRYWMALIGLILLLTGIVLRMNF